MNTIKFIVVVSITLLGTNFIINQVNGLPYKPYKDDLKDCHNYWLDGYIETYNIFNLTLSDKYLCAQFPDYDTYQFCIDNWKNDTILKERNITIEQVCGWLKDK